jgi:hypothetical protein
MAWRANGWQATTGFVADHTIRDGAPLTGYERLGGVGGTVEITGKVDIGPSAPACKSVSVVYRYTNSATLKLEYSHDDVSWTDPGASGPALPNHLGVYSAESFDLVLPVSTVARYWRLSVRDTDGWGVGCHVGLMEFDPFDPGGVEIPDYPGGGGGGGGGTTEGGSMGPVSGLTFAKGYLWGKPNAETVYDRPFAELQDTTMRDTLDFAEARGPGHTTVLGVGVRTREITGSARYAKIRARQFALLRGGTVVAGGGSTTYTAKSTDEPVLFDARFRTPSDGSDLEMVFYGCVAPDIEVPVTLKDFVYPNFGFRVVGSLRGNDVVLYEVTKQGDETTS